MKKKLAREGRVKSPEKEDEKGRLMGLVEREKSRYI